MRSDEVVARHVREAAEVDARWRTWSRQVAERLSQPAVTAEGVADDDRLRRALPEIELAAAGPEPVDLDLDREARIGAARPGERAAGEPAVGEAARPLAASASAPSVAR